MAKQTTTTATPRKKRAKAVLKPREPVAQPAPEKTVSEAHTVDPAKL